MPAQPLLIEGYARWTLQSVTPVSKHSAVYRFVSTDRKRGTPYVRGRGRTMWHKTCADPGRGCRTAGPRSGGCCVHVAFCSHAWLPWDSWHTTLLAEVGQNGEGPLPWVERDYTPISTWSEWERAPCRGCPTLGLRRPCRADALAPLSAQAARATS